MTVTSHASGHPIQWDGARWVHVATGEPVSPAIPCASCGLCPTVLNLNGAPREVDACIAPLVAWLNLGGFSTVASCCGHGHRPSSIALADGHWLTISPDQDTWNRIEKLFPLDIHGEPMEPEPTSPPG